MERDLRDVVEEDRGLVKRIQIIIPGYRGYRRREDLRIADSLLREEIYRRLGPVEKEAIEVRRRLAEGMALGRLDRFKDIIDELQVYRNRIRHAEQEYSGISPDYRITEEQLENMYEYDLRLFEAVDALAREIAAYREPMDDETFADRVEGTRRLLRDLNETFRMRTETIAEIVVRE